MHNIREILDNVYYVGVNDRRIDRFENMFPLENGVAYSSYLIKDEKNILMDSVDAAFGRQYIESKNTTNKTIKSHILFGVK